VWTRRPEVLWWAAVALHASGIQLQFAAVVALQRLCMALLLLLQLVLLL
jgi:hypothetical protein